MIGFDFETHLISEEQPVPRPVCLSLYNSESEDAELFVGHKDMVANLKQIIKIARSKPVIAHNMRFELSVIYTWFPEIRDLLMTTLENYPQNFICTKVNEQLLDNVRKPQDKTHRYGLDTVIKRYTGFDGLSELKSGDDVWRLRYNELEHVALEDWPEEAVDYAINDSYYAYVVYTHQQKPLKAANMLPEITILADFTLAIAEVRGFQIDKKRVERLENELKENLRPHYKLLRESGYGYFKDGKFKKYIKLLKEHVEETVTNPIVTAKGSIKVSTEALRVYTPQSDIIKSFLEIQKYEKILSAFVPDLKAADPYLRTSYNPVVSSGRTSSRKSSFYPSVNIQQMPRQVPDVTYDVRNCFKARPGYKLVAIDYGGLELCSVASQLNNYFGHSAMADILNQGDKPVDLHSMLAASVMSAELKKEISYEHFVRNKKDKKFAEYRQICKAINLGFPGGIGYDVMHGQLAKCGIQIPIEILQDKIGSEVFAYFHLRKFRTKHKDVRVRRVRYDEWQIVKDPLVALKAKFFNLYPELEVFLRKSHKDFQTGKKIRATNDWGETEWEPAHKFQTAGAARDNCTYTAVCNGYLMQTPGAQGAKLMLWNVFKNTYNNPNIHLMAFIHDEIIAEVKDDENIKQNVEKLCDWMIDSMKKMLSSVRITVEASWMDHWDKAGGDEEIIKWK